MPGYEDGGALLDPSVLKVKWFQTRGGDGDDVRIAESRLRLIDANGVHGVCLVNPTGKFLCLVEKKVKAYNLFDCL